MRSATPVNTRTATMVRSQAGHAMSVPFVNVISLFQFHSFCFRLFQFLQVLATLFCLFKCDRGSMQRVWCCLCVRQKERGGKTERQEERECELRTESESQREQNL